MHLPSTACVYRMQRRSVQYIESTWRQNGPLTFANHVNDIVRACNFHTRAQHHIRRYLNRYVANTIACSITQHDLSWNSTQFISENIFKGVTRFLTFTISENS